MNTWQYENTMQKSMNTNQNKVQICMFVYNLEDELEDSINSACKASQGLDYHLYVMCNGCKDSSLDVAKRLAKNNPRIVPVHIEFGDKADTWNTFVYEVYDDDSIPVFIDGDLTFAEKSIYNIVDYYLKHDYLNAVSGFPWVGGRSAKAWRKSLIENHEFTGNINVLSPRFIGDVKDRNVKLPIGLIGEDSMLGFLTATNLVDGTDSPSDRIGICENAIFIYPKLYMFSTSNIRLYLRRRVRYAMRRLQQDAIVPKLKKEGIDAMPVYANAIFDSVPLECKWQGLETVFTLLAIRVIKRNLSKEDNH